LFHPIQVVRVRQDRWVARDSSGDPARTPPRFGKSGNTSHQRTRPKEPEFDAPTYYSKSASRPAVNPAAPVPKLSVTRAVVGRSNQAARYVTGRVVAASRADGAAESGLTRLIWNQVLSYSADAMITVALAGTVFFSAAQSDQRGNVLGYLLITMAPFALVAPVIGRCWTDSSTAAAWRWPLVRSGGPCSPS
jgi:hypothetical protein